MAPNSAYLLLDAQPPSTVLYTPMEDMARKNSNPIFRSATSTFGAKGIIVKLMSTLATTTAGANTNTTLSAKGGIQSSLKNSLIVSASTMNSPKGPARLGP